MESSKIGVNGQWTDSGQTTGQHNASHTVPSGGSKGINYTGMCTSPLTCEYIVGKQVGAA